MENYDPIVLSGVILTFIASMLSIYISIKNSKSTQYIDKVITSRIDWIDKLRRVIAEFSQKSYLDETLREKITPETYLRVLELHNRIHLLIGHKNIFEINILETCKKLLENFQHYMELKEANDRDVEIELSTVEELSKSLVRDLLYYSEIYFKYEWNRIKIEGLGKKYTHKLDKINTKNVIDEYGLEPPEEKLISEEKSNDKSTKIEIPQEHFSSSV